MNKSNQVIKEYKIRKMYWAKSLYIYVEVLIMEQVFLTIKLY